MASTTASRIAPATPKLADHTQKNLNTERIRFRADMCGFVSIGWIGKMVESDMRTQAAIHGNPNPPRTYAVVLVLEPKLPRHLSIEMYNPLYQDESIRGEAKIPSPIRDLFGGNLPNLDVVGLRIMHAKIGGLVSGTVVPDTNRQDCHELDSHGDRDALDPPIDPLSEPHGHRVASRGSGSWPLSVNGWLPSIVTLNCLAPCHRAHGPLKAVGSCPNFRLMTCDTSPRVRPTVVEASPSGMR